MLLLTPFFNPELFDKEELEAIEDVDLDRALQIFEDIYEDAGSNGYNANVTADAAHDPEGNVYRDVRLVVTGKFNRNGERFLVGAGMAISLDAMLEAGQEALAYARSL